jgi:hypothetical protein
VAEDSPGRYRCPDNGQCNQFRLYESPCPGSCQRVRHSRPFPGRYPGDEWPDELVAAHYPAWHMLITAERALRDRYAAGSPLSAVTALPPGLRLEMHPAMYRLIMQDADGAKHGLGDVGSRLGVPVRVTTEVGRNAWRLVIVTEEVLAEGQAG